MKVKNIIFSIHSPSNGNDEIIEEGIFGPISLNPVATSVNPNESHPIGIDMCNTSTKISKDNCKIGKQESQTVERLPLPNENIESDENDLGPAIASSNRRFRIDKPNFGPRPTHLGINDKKEVSSERAQIKGTNRHKSKMTLQVQTRKSSRYALKYKKNLLQCNVMIETHFYLININNATIFQEFHQ